MLKLVPLILFLFGTGAGVGAGLFMRPEPEEPKVSPEATEVEKAPTLVSNPEVPDLGFQYVEMSNQFVVPIVKQDRIASMVVISLSIETADGRAEVIYDKEPKLRDAFLEVMFDHANIGGFDGNFTDVTRLSVLRGSLREVAQQSLGSDIVNDVLIVDMARQDY